MAESGARPSTGLSASSALPKPAPTLIAQRKQDRRDGHLSLAGLRRVQRGG